MQCMADNTSNTTLDEEYPKGQISKRIAILCKSFADPNSQMSLIISRQKSDAKIIQGGARESKRPLFTPIEIDDIRPSCWMIQH